ncbi:MAG: HlyD family efflux transporter periplasmic adaptor subunit [Treponema sp.]|jgi:HlyD family secretion protein|nr:HlyD family efflux transporter periplasmic adaptor subunit [Treponema sp.]
MNCKNLRYAAVIASVCSLWSCTEKIPSSYTGVIEGITCSVSSPTGDRLVSLTTDEGDFIQAGTSIGQIDGLPLDIRKKELEASVRQTALEEESNVIQLNQSRKNFSYYKTLYSKNKELLARKAVSEQSVQDLELQVDKWSDSSRSIQVQQKLLESKKSSIELQIQQVNNQLEKTILISPISGFVDKIYYRQGEFVPAFHTVADIVDLNHIWCYIYVAPSVVSTIKQGMLVTVKLGQQLFSGKVAHINTQSEFTPKNILTPDNRNSMVYGVKISITNRDNLLKIGQPVDVLYQEVQHDN